MLNLRRNNLDLCQSPYLLQHTDNPIWWQEWSGEILKAAASQNKPLFVSVGYATCHWCHVMAAEAFSHRETADFLNGNFINIKVDREQRPDIDRYLMNFLTSLTGSGGWPLNVFLTPDLRPIFALTYAPAVPARGMHSFLTIARHVHEHYADHSGDIPPFSAIEEEPPVAEEESLIKKLYSRFDAEYGGFGREQKFPPHSTLLYLLYSLCVEDNAGARSMVSATLDRMRLSGLTDHLQGGIFRYCVDRGWTIPHFEKMLYDQVMALWCYSLAYRVLHNHSYRVMAESIIRCLRDSFEEEGLFISGHDADTDHNEGATYVWRYDELQKLLTVEEFKRFTDVYSVSEHGNFEGGNHLVRKNGSDIEDIEKKLLAVRKNRPQPGQDNKILCGLNALTAMALLQAARNLNRPELEDKAAGIIRRLLDLFWDGTRLGHSCFRGIVQEQSFLFDAAAVLTAMTMLNEHDDTWQSLMTGMAGYVQSFREGGTWMESRSSDFMHVSASLLDHPVPSSVSLAEMGIARAALLIGAEVQPDTYREPFYADFFNVGVMMKSGLFHVVTTKSNIEWVKLQPNTIQVRGDQYADCYRGQCSVMRINKSE